MVGLLGLLVVADLALVLDVGVVLLVLVHVVVDDLGAAVGQEDLVLACSHRMGMLSENAFRVHCGQLRDRQTGVNNRFRENPRSRRKLSQNRRRCPHRPPRPPPSLPPSRIVLHAPSPSLYLAARLPSDYSTSCQISTAVRWLVTQPLGLYRRLVVRFGPAIKLVKCPSPPFSLFTSY